MTYIGKLCPPVTISVYFLCWDEHIFSNIFMLNRQGTLRSYLLLDVAVYIVWDYEQRECPFPSSVKQSSAVHCLVVRQSFPYHFPFASWTWHLSLGTYCSVCSHVFSDFRAITTNVRALHIQFWTLRVMCCSIFIDAFPSAVPIATLDGQCSVDLVQGDVIFQRLAIEINTAYRAFASWTF